MMSRYFTRRPKPKPSTECVPGKPGGSRPSGSIWPRSDGWWEDEGLVLNSLTVADHEAADTGLIDVNGDAIMRAPNPMGFVWEEWD